MLDRLIWGLAAAMALFGAPVRSETGVPQAPGPAREIIDVSARPLSENRAAECRLTGEVVLWASRPVAILDDMRVSLGVVEAGLAQFAKGSKLEGCVPDGATLNLSDQFANFLLVNDRLLRGEAFGRQEAAGFGSQLARDFYQLAELEGAAIPLVEGIELRAMGSVSYRFRIVLIHDADARPIDVVIVRETLGTKFSPRLTDSDRHASARRWSSLAQAPVIRARSAAYAP